jgi:uncharacterized protein HemX
MDDEAKQLLREMRDMMRQAHEGNAAWRQEMRANAKRGRRIALFILLPALLLGLSMITWGMISSGQKEREYDRFREEIRRRMEERRNQLRPKEITQASQPGYGC